MILDSAKAKEGKIGNFLSKKFYGVGEERMERGMECYLVRMGD
jgi:hypothetical protein